MWRPTRDFPRPAKRLKPTDLVSWKMRRLGWSWALQARIGTADSDEGGLGYCGWWNIHMQDIWWEDEDAKDAKRRINRRKSLHRRR